MRNAECVVGPDRPGHHPTSAAWSVRYTFGPVSRIAGIVGFGGDPPDPSELGVGAEGSFRDKSALLFRGRRTGETVEQPVVSDRFALVVDGRIWEGWRTLLDRWAKVGVAALQEIIGPFALAVWDRRDEVLWLARGAVGTRALFWSRPARRVAFASEMAPLLRLGWISKEVATGHVAEYLSFRYVHSPRTLLREVYSVPPGHVVRIDDTGERVERWWNPPWSPPDAPLGDDGETAARIDAVLHRAVERRLGGGRVGVLLSGGLDSSAILHHARTLGAPPPTFTVAFEDDPSAEAPYAGRIAKLMGAEHHAIRLEPTALVDAIESCTKAMGVPLPGPAALVQHAFFLKTRGHVAVALSGEGGDEVLGGRGLGPIAAGLRGTEAVRALPGPIRGLARGLAGRIGLSNLAVTGSVGLERVIGGSDVFPEKERIAILQNPAHVRPGIRREVLEPFYAEVASDAINEILHVRQVGWLAEDTIARSERMAAQAGLENPLPDARSRDARGGGVDPGGDEGAAAGIRVHDEVAAPARDGRTDPRPALEPAQAHASVAARRVVARTRRGLSRRAHRGTLRGRPVPSRGRAPARERAPVGLPQPRDATVDAPVLPGVARDALARERPGRRIRLDRLVVLLEQEVVQHEQSDADADGTVGDVEARPLVGSELVDEPALRARAVGVDADEVGDRALVHPIDEVPDGARHDQRHGGRLVAIVLRELPHHLREEHDGDDRERGEEPLAERAVRHHPERRTLVLRVDEREESIDQLDLVAPVLDVLDDQVLRDLIEHDEEDQDREEQDELRREQLFLEPSAERGLRLGRIGRCRRGIGQDRSRAHRSVRGRGGQRTPSVDPSGFSPRGSAGHEIARSCYGSAMTKGEDTRRAILDQAVGIAATVGLSGLTVGQLADELDMSKSGLFAHFRSKEALQLAVLEAAVGQFVDAVVRPGLSAPRGEQRLRAILDGWLEWGLSRPRGGCVFIASSVEFDDRPGVVRDRIAATQKDWIEFLATCIRTGQNAGAFRKDADPEDFAWEVYGLMLATHQATRLLDDPEAPRRARRSLERLIAGLRPEP